MNFDILIKQVEQTHDYLQRSSMLSVNLHLTIRNWLVGFYIVEFEQEGSDRAAYGENLLNDMAKKLKHIKGLSISNLKTFRVFYLTYPQLAQLFIKPDTINSKPLKMLVVGFTNYLNQKSQSATGFFEMPKKAIGQSPTALSEFLQNQKGQMPSALSENKMYVPVEKLITSLSFSHLAEIIRMDDPLKRVFYEIEAIKGNWTVKELKRQINTLLFERTGMSENKAKLLQQVHQKAETPKIENAVRNPYFFEFLGLKDKDVVSENDLETALLNHLQEFILELGEGFCFEARQKRITMGNKYFYVDLVFYHRILKCHILIELKVNEVDYAAVTQLNSYVSYYRKNVMQTNDKPTIGILMCANKDEPFVEYALAGLDEKIFVSQYLLYIPNKEKLEQFIKQEISGF